MAGKPRILAINGSYRTDGITDQAVEAAANVLRENGADVETVLLREYDIEFCTNCRSCTQEPGTAPGQCVQNDGMRELVRKIEAADGYILAAPTNMGSVTAVFKRFMERLAVFAYWPWGAPAPRMRRAGMAPKKALLVSSCAAPGLMGRWLYSTRRELQAAAEAIGARPVGTVFTGLIAKASDTRMPRRTRKKAASLARKLA